MPIDQHELVATLNALLENANLMRSALMKRDAATIAAVSGTQESLVNQVRYMERRGLPGGTGDNKEMRETVSNLIARIKTVQRTNKALASAFLTVINRTFAALCTGPNIAAGTYGSSGNRDVNISSLLIQQQG